MRDALAKSKVVMRRPEIEEIRPPVSGRKASNANWLRYFAPRAATQDCQMISIIPAR
jgi:hypothetical protein